MANLSFTMKDIWNESTYLEFCKTEVMNITNVTTLEYPPNMDVYIFKPIWRRFANSNAKFNNTDEGKESFIANFTNQIQEIALDFYYWCKSNVEFFTKFINEEHKDKALNKGIISSASPINQQISQNKYDTEFAQGTTYQSVSEIINVGVAWNASVKQYMTPQKKNAMLDSFRWLFVNAIPTYKQAEVVGVIDDLGTYSTNGYDFMEVDPTNITPENIKESVNILGVEGTLKSLDPTHLYKRITQNGLTQYVAEPGTAYSSVEIDINVPSTTLVSATREYTANGTYEINANVGESFKKITIDVDVPPDVILYAPSYIGSGTLDNSDEQIATQIKNFLTNNNIKPYALVPKVNGNNILFTYEEIPIDNITVMCDSMLDIFDSRMNPYMNMPEFLVFVHLTVTPLFGVKIPNSYRPTRLIDTVEVLARYNEVNDIITMCIKGVMSESQTTAGKTLTIVTKPQFTIRRQSD